MKKIGSRAPVFAMILIACVICGILATLMFSTRSFIYELLLAQAKTSNDSFAYSFEAYQEEALERAEMIAASKEVIEAVEKRDSDMLLEALNAFSSGLDLVTLCDADGNVLMRTHSDKKGDSVLSQRAITIALSTGKGIKTIEQGTVIGLSTRGSAAIKDDNGNIIGALTCGHDLSLPKYIDAIKEQSHCEATFFAGDERMSTTLLDENGERAIGTKANDAVIQKVIDNKQDYSGRIDLFGNMYEVYYSPVIVDDTVIGMLFTGVDVNSSLEEERQLIVLIAVAVVMLILAIFLTVFLISSSTRKAYWYESMLDSLPFPLSVTDMNMKWTFVNKPVEEMLKIKRADVVGKHCSNWGAGICNTDKCGINRLRSGKQTTFFKQMGMDFRVDSSYLYDSKGREIGHIELVQEITQMLKAQKAQALLVEKINDAANAFISGSKQVADGSQALARGSTEQAASIQQLSSSISEITDKTKYNADMAGKAATLADTIKANAEKGNRQMDEMMSAVKEINIASQSINKVIRVIDDIAFQTNILALNAAVEAARAGQHGKGFAVVAEEVRNLAAKSAEAAKDTDSLIANSMMKAELGARIADETAASLTEIVSGISESTSLVSEIAKSSEEQSESISQINLGLEQVAQIVQQNSATAEESAAASAEMSEQAEILNTLIIEFGVNDD